MKTIVKTSLALATVALFAGISVQAQVLFTTQNDFSPWNSGAGTVSVGTLGDSDFSTVNGLGNTVTPGGLGTAGAVTFTIASTGWNPISSQEESGNTAFINTLASSATLSLTYTLASDITTGSGGYWQLRPVLNSSAGYDILANDSFFTVASGNLTAGQHTVTYNVSGAPTGSLGYFQFLIVVNDGGTGLAGGYNQVSFDNITVAPVPEPASIALCMMGVVSGLVLIRRKA